MKYLITGGAGFLGSNMCDRLLNEGHYVTCVDNYSTGKRDNIEHLYSNPRFTVIEQDVVNPLVLTEDIDVIFHLACPASPIHYQADPIGTTITNVCGTKNVLDFATEKKAIVIQASTSEVYGDPLMHPQTESYRGNVNTIGPRACYDEGKRCAESLCFDYMRMFGTEVKVARLFNTYGPHMALSDGRVMSNFIVQALVGNSLTVHGRGSQTRCFCYVDDMIEGLLRLSESDRDFCGPVNLGNPHEIAILDLARMIINKINPELTIAFEPLPVDDPKRRKPDIRLAERILDWQPRTALDIGIDRTINYFREVLNNDPKLF